MVRRLAVIGVGLIGGSFAMALRNAGLVEHVTGIGRSRENLDSASKLGVIDRATTSVAEGVQHADLIFIAVPTRQLPPVLLAMDSFVSPEALITDAGSTKQDVVAEVNKLIPRHAHRFVPGHPIAGAERSGAAAATANLYQGKRVVLTPTANTDSSATQVIEDLWRACGAQVSRMSADRHDGIFAAVSHLPHALAYALVHRVASSAEREVLFSFAASGFRDFTRIASSSPEMWRDICLTNQAALLRELDGFRDDMARLRTLIAAGEEKGLESFFGTAREARENWLASKYPP